MSLKKPTNIKITTAEGKLKENLVEITKKTLSFGLAATLAITALPVSAFGQSADEADAYEAVSAVSEAVPEEEMAEYENKVSTMGDMVGTYSSSTGDFSYIVSDDMTATIVGCDESATSVVFPAEIDGYKVTGIDDKRTYCFKNLTSVVISDGITSINDGAFYCCENLTSITIPNSVTSIGDHAFYNCSSLTSITIPDSVTSIGDYAFSDCVNLTSIVIPDSVTSIGYGAFYDCTSLADVTVPDSVTDVSSSAFRNTAFEDDESNWENGVLYIGKCLVDAKSDITTANIKSGTVTISDFAFDDCESLTSITIPKSVTYIGSDAFEDTGYSMEDSNWDNGLLYIGNWLVDSLSNVTTAEIKTGTVGIAEGIFRYNAYLTSVTIPKGITSIGYGAFSECNKLTSVTIPNSVTTIGDNAFYNCASVTSITIPNGVTTIGDDAFSNCDSLTSIIIPDSVTTIGDDAFSGCDNLTSVIIPDSVTSIGDSAFSWCTSLTSIEIPDSVTSIGEGIFSCCTSLTSITIPDSIISIGDKAFYDTAYYNDESNWNKGLLYIDNWLIKADAQVATANIKAGTVGIADRAFNTVLTISPDYCDKLTSVKIPDGVKYIGDSAFEWCNNLTSITIPDSVTSISHSAFYYCSSLTSITIPNSVTSIGRSAFYCCSSLTSINISANFKYVGEEAFRYSGLTKVTISDKVTAIRNSVFASCNSLTDVYYEGSPSQWKKVIIAGGNESLNNATIHYGREDVFEITAAYPGNGKVRIEWNPKLGATKYRVFYYLNGKFTTVANTTATNRTITGLTNGTKYGFLVRAYVDGKWTSYTIKDVVYATPINKPVVTAYAGNSKVRLSWTKVTGATKYAIYTYLNGKYTLYKATTANYYNVAGLTNGTKYGFLVKAYVNGKWTTYNTYDLAYATPVEKPVVTAYAGNGKVRLNWTKVTGATKYAIYTYVNGKYTLYKATTATAYNVTGLTNGTKYGFLVKAYVNGKWTTYNTYDLAYATPIDKPVITKAVAASGRVRLYWNKVAGATKYAIFTYSGGKYKLYKYTTANAYTVSGLKNGTAYGFLVRAYVNGKWTTYNAYDRVSATPKA